MRIIILLIILLMIPLVSANEGDYGANRYGYGIYGYGETLIKPSEPTTDLSSPAGSQQGDRTPEQIATDTTPDGKTECEEQGFIFYNNTCYHCNSKNGMLIFDRETQKIMCQTCGEGYTITEDGKCIQELGADLKKIDNWIKSVGKILYNDPLLVLFGGLIFIGVAVELYKDNSEKVKKNVRDYLKNRKKQKEEEKTVEEKIEQEAKK